MDRSVSEASVALRDIERHDLVQYNGTAIGFGLKMASGSSGDSVTMNSMYEAFSSMEAKTSFLQVLRFFILTRYETAESNRTHPHRAEIISPTFYDYRDHETFIDDFTLCVDECDTFSALIVEAEGKLGSIIKSDEVIVVDKEGEHIRFIQHVSRLLQKSSLDEIFPRAQQIIPELFFRQVYDQMKARIVPGREDCFDSVLIDGIVSGADLVGLLCDFMMAHSMLKSPIKKNRDRTVICLYINSLRSRGYNSDEIRELAPPYLDGRMSLTKKRCFFFEAISNVLRLTQETRPILQIDATKLLEIISVCEKKLGFNLHSQV
jgi:hypothetical protein